MWITGNDCSTWSVNARGKHTGQHDTSQSATLPRWKERNGGRVTELLELSVWNISYGRGQLYKQMGIHGEGLKGKQDGTSNKNDSADWEKKRRRREKCLTLYLAVSVLLRIMSVILTVSRLNYSPPDGRFTSLPWSRFRAHEWSQSSAAEIYFLTRAHNNIKIFPPFLPLYSKSKLRLFLAWRWVACVRSSESAVLHMALTVRAPSQQTQLRAPNSCYDLVPNPAASRPRKTCIYSWMTYNRKMSTTSYVELKGKPMQHSAKLNQIEHRRLFQSASAAASLVASCSAWQLIVS